MTIITIIFWITFSLIFYAYIGYGIIIKFIVYIKDRFVSQISSGQFDFPPVTMIIAAYNEEIFIKKKIENCLSLNYPGNKLKFLFITDGSTDNTAKIVASYNDLLVLHQNERKGKTDAINRAMQYVKHPIVIFSDANALLNKDSILNIVRHYKNPRIGGVAGEKKVINNPLSKAAGSGEGLYWKYESWLKKTDAALYTVVGAAGELFSIRTELFEPLPQNVILDDFVLSLSIVKKGYRFAYEPEAYATETASISMIEEQKRKVRICAGGFQAMTILKSLLNIFRYRVASFQYISHRVLRWAVVPFCLPVILATNMFLVISGAGNFYNWLLVAQIFFYMLVLTGLLLAHKNIKIKILYIPYYFFFMNWTVYLGLLRFLRGKQTVTWEKASREEFTEI
jgi:poly-beta-1,6-N-acetyl-D-glucosamine synthase